MKRARWISLLLVGTLVLCLWGCQQSKPSGSGGIGEAVGVWPEPGEYVMTSYVRSAMVTTDSGYYIGTHDINGLPFLYYMDKEGLQWVPVCGKPECAHIDQNCNACIGATSIGYYEGNIYYAETSFNGIDGFDEAVWRMEGDGSNHQEVRDIPGGCPSNPYYHRGKMFYVSQGELRMLDLEGADGQYEVITKAEGEEEISCYPYQDKVYIEIYTGEYQDLVCSLWVYDISTKETKLLTEEWSPSLNWCITEDALYAIHTGKGLMKYDFASGQLEDTGLLSEEASTYAKIDFDCVVYGDLYEINTLGNLRSDLVGKIVVLNLKDGSETVVEMPEGKKLRYYGTTEEYLLFYEEYNSSVALGVNAFQPPAWCLEKSGLETGEFQWIEVQGGAKAME